MSYIDVLGQEWEFYCDVCSGYANEECDCCVECQVVIDDCECVLG